MPSQWWHDDDLLLAELRRTLTGQGREPVPEELLRAGRGAYTWRSVDDELADLVYDTLLEDGELAGIRGAAPARAMVFDGSALSLDVEVSGLRITGQVVPPQPGVVSVAGPGIAGHAEPVDEAGRFTVRVDRAGPVRLRCTAADGASITTRWIQLRDD